MTKDMQTTGQNGVSAEFFNTIDPKRLYGAARTTARNWTFELIRGDGWRSEPLRWTTNRRTSGRLAGDPGMTSDQFQVLSSKAQPNVLCADAPEPLETTSDLTGFAAATLNRQPAPRPATPSAHQATHQWLPQG